MLKVVKRTGSELPNLLETIGTQPLRVGRTNSPKPLHWQGGKKVAGVFGPDNSQAIGLVNVGSQLGKEFVSRNTCRASQSSLAMDRNTNRLVDVDR